MMAGIVTGYHGSCCFLCEQGIFVYWFFVRVGDCGMGWNGHQNVQKGFPWVLGANLDKYRGWGLKWILGGILEFIAKW